MFKMQFFYITNNRKILINLYNNILSFIIIVINTLIINLTILSIKLDFMF